MKRLFTALALSSAIASAQAQSSGGAVPVTPDNFTRAETDMYFDMFAKRGGFGKFDRARGPLEQRPRP
jgi:hypothetical protein